MPRPVIRMQRSRPAIAAHAPGIHVQPPDLIGTELTEKQMFPIGCKHGTMNMGRILAGQVGTAGAGNQQRVQRGDSPVLPEAINAQCTTGIVGDGQQDAVGRDVAGIFALCRQTGGLDIDLFETVAAPAPGPDGGCAIRHLRNSVHLVALDRQVRRIGHFRLRDRAVADEASGTLVEVIGIEPVGIRADKHRQHVRTRARGEGQGQQKEQIPSLRSE